MASALLDELTGDLQPPGVNGDLVSATSEDKMLQTVRLWVESGKPPPPPPPVVRVLRNGSGAPLLATTDWEFESGLIRSTLAPSVSPFRGLSTSGSS